MLFCTAMLLELWVFPWISLAHVLIRELCVNFIQGILVVQLRLGMPASRERGHLWTQISPRAPAGRWGAQTTWIHAATPAGGKEGLLPLGAGQAV